MAFDKQHISELKKEILLVKKLGDKVGYLVLLNIACAIFKNKDITTMPKHHSLKQHLTQIINDIENHDEDYCKLVQETLKEISESDNKKEEPEIPTLDYWMLNIISEALQKEYDKRSKERGLTKVLSQIAEKEGLERCKEVKAEVDSNRWDDVGQVACCMNRIEKIKESITLSVKES